MTDACDSLAAVPTPAALVDVDIAATNHAALLALSGPLSVRPHFKAHKTTALLGLQRSTSTTAICAQTAHEALVAGTVADDVLVTNQVVDPSALRALAAAARSTMVTALVDDPRHVELLSSLTRHHGLEIGVLIEVDVGMRRCGVPPDGPELGRLAEQVLAAPGLALRGLQGYEGHAAGIVDPQVRQRTVGEAAARLAIALTALDGAFTGTALVGGGATGTTSDVRAAGVWTETQAGSYLLMDGAYGAMAELPYRQALFLLATVLHSDRERAVIDVGLKSVAVDRGAPQPVRAGLSITRVSDEHAVVDLAGARPPAVGERLLLVPGHVDPTMNLFPEVSLVRGTRRAIDAGDAGDALDAIELIGCVPVDGRRGAAA